MIDVQLASAGRGLYLAAFLAFSACTSGETTGPAEISRETRPSETRRSAPRRVRAAGSGGGAAGMAGAPELSEGGRAPGPMQSAGTGDGVEADAGAVQVVRPDAGTTDASVAIADGGMPAPETTWTEGSIASTELSYEPQDEARYIFDPQQVRTYRVSVDPAELARIDRQPSTEEPISARLEFEGQSYGPYMMRYKGAAGSFRPPCTTEGRDGAKAGKCSFKLEFDEADPELRFFGLKSLNFQALNTDASMLRERLGYALFREFGLAAPRAVHARVFINDVFEGLFAAIEQVDGRFTRARFSEGGEGNLYKEVWPVHTSADAYLSQLKTNEDENPSVDGMLRLHQAVMAGASELAKLVDREYMLRYLAVDRVVMNDDGALHFYCEPSGSAPVNHNFYWYEAQQTPRFWLIPWDLDQSFHSSLWAHIEPKWSAAAPCTCNQVREGYQFPASCDPLVRRFIEWLPDYEARVDQFLAGPFSAARVEAHIAGFMTQLDSVVREAEAAGKGYAHGHWLEAVQELRGEIDLARRHRGAPY